MASEHADNAAPGDRVVATSRSADIAVSLLLLALALVLGWDSYRIGAGWASDGPQAGYFPFYLAVIMGVACVYGLAKAVISRHGADHTFVTRGQLYRVMQVFFPTFLFVVLTQFLGLYVASFLLVLGFMWYVGNIALWKSVTASLVFTTAMFVTFEIAFNVVMPKGPLEAVLGF